MIAHFVLALTSTVLCLAGVVWSGVSRRRRLHYGLVVAFLALLSYAIYQAERYGATLVFEGPAHVLKQVHLGAVAAVFLLLPVLAVSGVRLARSETPGRRLLHRRLGVAFVIVVLMAAALGTAMTVAARPKATAASAAPSG